MSDAGGFDGIFAVYVTPQAPMPTSKEDCKHGGWAEYGFSSQAECIAWVKDHR
jgi:hypothetical protein